MTRARGSDREEPRVSDRRRVWVEAIVEIRGFAIS
jgi:hypothetical protein